MFRNDFKIAWRILSKQKMYSFIKIGGFALGIAACLLIALFIRDELGYDLHYSNGDRIYRVLKEYNDNGELGTGVDFAAPFAKALKAEFPDVEQAGRLLPHPSFGAGSNLIRRADQTENAYEEGFAYLDQETLQILQVPMVHGDPAHALDEPNTIVLSRRKATKYFADDNPVGKLMVVNDNQDRLYRIGGVMEDFPAASHLHYDFLLSLTGVEFWPGEQTNWPANNYHTYVRLRPGADAARLEANLPAIKKKYIVPGLLEAGYQDAAKMEMSLKFNLQPVGDIHLKSNGITDRLSHGDIRFVWLFGAVAGFILLLAGINFINLSTARSANRAKEVGLRKVVGSFRRHLIRQFLTESLLFSFLSFGLGIGLAWLLLPYFNVLSAKSLTFPWREWWLLPLLVLAATAIGILAGLYPSFYLSAFQPIQVLKGNLSRGSKSSTLRSGLVVFQFTTSIVLIVGTLVIHRQMGYILHKKVGFDKDQVLLIQGANSLGGKVNTFKQELLRLPRVQHVSVSEYLPIKGTNRDRNPFWKEGRTAEDKPVGGQMWVVDHDYIKTMGMQVVAGRDFSLQMPTDSQAVIINQKMAEELGLENPVGQRITNKGAIWPVIGVVEDFHFESLKENITPLVLVIGQSPSIVSVKVKTVDMAGLIQSVTGVWKQVAPHQPIRYTFLDEGYAAMYEDVQRMGRVFTSFAVLAIIVAGLGLFALSAFMVEQRRKEISIRLVLGASGYSIFGLLTQNFLKLVLLSLVLAVPMAWYGMQKWLEDFVYRIEIGWDVFLLAGLMAVLIAILTISYQSIRAALMNPVKSLRSE
ncbi:MAG: ABC transporter permease [Ferruginibacter sp.]|nr:ABC transporter permease [Cytophagales bacterium]